MTLPPGRPGVFVNVHGVGPVADDATDDERAYWVGHAELAAVLDAVVASPEPVGITCDDGFASDVELVLPMLVERGLRAAFFPCAGWLGRPGRVDADDVGQLLAAGMTVGSHGWSHRDWRRLSPAEAGEEFGRARDVLAEVTGRPVTAAAVPFGRYDRTVLRHLRAAGFETVYTSDGGLAPARTWRVPRTSVRPGADARWLGRVLADARRPTARARAVLARTVKAVRS